MVKTFGEVDWESADVGGSRPRDGEEKKDLFLRLDNGDNEVRLLTQPYQYIMHKYKKNPDDKKDFGQKINCSQASGHCPLCEAGDRPKARWFVGVLDRKTNTTKILDLGPGVLTPIKKLASNPKWGDPTKYDICIIVDKKAAPAQYYTVQPLSKEPLTAEEQSLKDNFDLEELRKRVTPNTPERVQASLDRINKSGPQGSTSESTSKMAVAAKVEEEEDEEFPDYGT